jgi:hypothetical protein
VLVGRGFRLRVAVHSQSQDRLHRDEERGHVERLKEEFGGAFAILARIQRRLGEQQRMLVDDVNRAKRGFADRTSLDCARSSA